MTDDADPFDPGERRKATLIRTTPFQRATSGVIDLILVALAFWVLSGFFGALAWAVVLAIATWPLYERFQSLFDEKRRRTLPAILFTLIVALVFIVPFGVAVTEAFREAKGVTHWIGEAEKTGVPVPAQIEALPMVGARIAGWWTANLTEPGAITDLLGRTDTGKFARITQEIGVIIARRLSLFLFTALTLFFLFHDGVTLAKRFQRACHRLMGEPGEHLVTVVVSAVRSTADGLVLVGLGEGAVIGISYEIFGAPHPALLAAFTGLLAMIPFGAPIIFTLASAVLLVTGNIFGAIGISVVGWIVIGIADHAIRPALIGGAAKLPFLWVLLGIFGGLETFGLVGLFLGPAIMAAFISLWREWTDPVPRRLTQKAG
ncbi:MAG TPA: AI-2E family transporter [Alphaproteobacteria bacterium]|nr:AI-2E family transporter [Alphaproteobacteria bacterium]